MKKIRFMIGIFSMLTLIVNGQNISELSQALATMKNSAYNKIRAEGAHLDSLLNDVQPTLYIENNIITEYGNTAPRCVNISSKSLIKLEESNSLYNEVELITITLNTIEDMNFVIDISRLQSFGNLKYINVKCYFETEPDMITDKIQIINNKNLISLYYTLSKKG